jgi:predicted RNA-binding Zn-ribbon protein involved in translation (DUF1610 family)
METTECPECGLDWTTVDHPINGVELSFLGGDAQTVTSFDCPGCGASFVHDTTASPELRTD